jgi:hypothetical protein
LSFFFFLFCGVAIPPRPPPPPSHGRARSGIGDGVSRSSPSTLSSPVQAGSAGPAQSASARREGPARPIALASDSTVKDFEPEPAHTARSGGADSLRSDGSNSGQRIDSSRRPASAFTIVLANETLQDVARRVYGSGDLADPLWRANRDALSRRESPLAAGMVLRTPVAR